MVATQLTSPVPSMHCLCTIRDGYSSPPGRSCSGGARALRAETGGASRGSRTGLVDKGGLGESVLLFAFELMLPVLCESVR